MPPINRSSPKRTVKPFQAALERLGYPLARYGADGYFGHETDEAAALLAEHRGWIADASELLADPLEVPPWLYDLVMEEAEKSAAMPEELHCSPDSLCAHGGSSDLIVDNRAEAWAGRRRRKNPLSAIDTICLHQMAVASVPQRRSPGVEVPDSLRRYGATTGAVYTSNKTGKWERWRKLAIHFAITCGPESRAHWLHDLHYRLPHGHGWNRRSVGIEVEGFFAGCHDLQTGTHKGFWKPKSRPNRLPMVPTEAQLAAGRAACRFISAEIARQGGRIQFIGAHRQSYGIKASDPGALIWKGIALPIMEELNLTEAPELPHKKYKGKPIPECWNPNNRGIDY